MHPFLRALSDTATEASASGGSSADDLDPKVFWPVNAFIFTLVCSALIGCYCLGGMPWLTNAETRRLHSDEQFEARVRRRQEQEQERRRGTPEKRKKQLMRSFQRCKVHMIVKETDLVDSKEESQNEIVFKMDSEVGSYAPSSVVLAADADSSIAGRNQSAANSVASTEKKGSVKEATGGPATPSTADGASVQSSEKSTAVATDAQVGGSGGDEQGSVVGDGSVASSTVKSAHSDEEPTTATTALGEQEEGGQSRVAQEEPEDAADISSNDGLSVPASLPPPVALEEGMDDSVADSSIKSGSYLPTQLLAVETAVALDDVDLEAGSDQSIGNPDFMPLDDTSASNQNGFLILRETPEDEFSVRRRVPNCCAICLGSYEVGEHVVWSSNEKCAHAFHMECLVDWLTKMRDGTPCPCCRAEFTDLEKHRKERRILWRPGNAFNPEVVRLR